jgi:DNA-binding MarR family transcriptional regulator
MSTIPNILVSKVLLEDNNLSSSEIILLSLVYQLENAGKCFATNAYFGKVLHLSDKRVNSILSDLEKKTYIQRTKDSLHKSGREIKLNSERFSQIANSFQKVYTQKEGVASLKSSSNIPKNEAYNTNNNNLINLGSVFIKSWFLKNSN